MIDIAAIRERWPDPAPYPNQASRDVADLLAEVERLKPLAGESGVWKAEALRYREEQHRLEAKVAHIEASGPDHDLRACSTFVREFSDRLMETGRERDALAAEVKHVESDLEHCREAGKVYQRQYEKARDQVANALEFCDQLPYAVLTAAVDLGANTREYEVTKDIVNRVLGGVRAVLTATETEKS